MTDQTYIAGEPGWLYPPLDAAPSPGAKVTLLTKGFVQVVGNWTNDGSFIAWSPLLKRNKEKEIQLNYLLPGDYYERINEQPEGRCGERSQAGPGGADGGSVLPGSAS